MPKPCIPFPRPKFHPGEVGAEIWPSRVEHPEDELHAIPNVDENRRQGERWLERLGGGLIQRTARATGFGDGGWPTGRYRWNKKRGKWVRADRS